MKSPQDANSKSHQKLSDASAVTEFAAHYRQVYPRLAAVAAGVLGRQEGAEDIVQDAAGIAVAKGKQFATASAFAAWMVGVVRRCALNERRKTQRRRTYATSPTDLADMAGSLHSNDAGVDPATGRLASDQESFEDSLQNALQLLSEQARCCLLLRTVHELSYQEIGELLGIPQGTAMSHVHRSRQQLRQFLMETQATHAPDRPECKLP